MPHHRNRIPSATDKETVRNIRLPGGFALLVDALPFTTPDGSRFVVESGAPYGEIEIVLRGLLLTFAIYMPFIVSVAVGGGYWLMRRSLQPIDELRNRAEGITSTNLNERLPVIKTGDELERLSVSLNRMIARLEHAFQHINRFSADASHELRTPLTILRGELEAIVRRPQLASDVRETIGSTLEETDRLTKITESLLALSRLDAGEAQMEQKRFDFAELVASTVEQMRLLAEDKNISLRGDAAERVEVEGSPARLKQVI